MSRPRVTITLGRSGQVVKRAPDDNQSQRMPFSGRKRSVRERLGSNSDNPFFYGNEPDMKRLRPMNMADDCASEHEDLRAKLLRKNLRRPPSNGNRQITSDLREKLTRSTQPPSRPGFRLNKPDSRDASFPGRAPFVRSADDLLPMEPTRRPSSAWNIESLRRRSPERGLIVSRAVSPPADSDSLRRYSVRAPDPSRQLPSSLPPRQPASFEARKIVPRVTSGSAAPVLPVINGAMTPGLAGELTVAGLLQSLGLGKYGILFQAEEVDMTALKQMGDGDLKELGIPMGPRKKILLALLPRKPRQA